MLFRGLEIDFDIYDVQQAQEYEQALENVLAACEQHVPDEGLADGIRRQCNVVFDFFDDLFGEGFHTELFGDKTNLMTCLDAFQEFTDAVNEQKTALSTRLEQLAPNHAARRMAPRKSSSTAPKR